MAATKRLFVAVDPTSENVVQIEQTIDHLQSIAPQAKWMRAEKLHVTLVFLGAIDETKLPAVIEAIRAGATMHVPFAIRFVGGGTFGEKEHLRVLWTGIGGNTQALCTLQQDLATQLVTVGYSPDYGTYAPHLTLAHAGNPQGDEKFAECVDQLDGRSFGETTIREVVLYCSGTGEKSGKYRELIRIPLRV